MVQEVAKGDGLAIVRKLRQILPYIIVKREFSVLLQEHERKRHELLGNRSDVKDGVRLDVNIVLEVG